MTACEIITKPPALSSITLSSITNFNYELLKKRQVIEFQRISDDASLELEVSPKKWCHLRHNLASNNKLVHD